MSTNNTSRTAHADPTIHATPSTLGLVMAFLSVYLIWGSTYLAIRYAVETLPPLLMAGTRFLVAGSIVYAFVRLRGVPRPTRLHWRSTLIIGALLLLGGNGGVVWAEQTVPSSVAALLITSVPIWMVLLDWLRPGGVRPGAAVAAGVVLGFGGVVLLFATEQLADGRPMDRIGALILVCGSFCWSLGSVWSRRIALPSSPLLVTGMEMLCGGVLLTLAGLAFGEGAKINLDGITALSVASLIYLIVFGSLVAFSSYVWLLKHSTPASVSTYAFVNPVVAVLIGVTIGGEPIGWRMVLASLIILAGVVLITLKPGSRRRVVAQPAQPSSSPIPEVSRVFENLEGRTASLETLSEAFETSESSFAEPPRGSKAHHVPARR